MSLLAHELAGVGAADGLDAWGQASGSQPAPTVTTSARTSSAGDALLAFFGDYAGVNPPASTYTAGSSFTLELATQTSENSATASEIATSPGLAGALATATVTKTDSDVWQAEILAFAPAR
jgi:hypothetical protein